MGIPWFSAVEETVDDELGMGVVEVIATASQKTKIETKTVRFRKVITIICFVLILLLK